MRYRVYMNALPEMEFTCARFDVESPRRLRLWPTHKLDTPSIELLLPTDFATICDSHGRIFYPNGGQVMFLNSNPLAPMYTPLVNEQGAPLLDEILHTNPGEHAT
jgi:hypothetical protein